MTDTNDAYDDYLAHEDIKYRQKQELEKRYAELKHRYESGDRTVENELNRVIDELDRMVGY